MTTAEHPESGSTVTRGTSRPARLDTPFRELCNLTESYLSSTDVDEIYRAYKFGAKAHAGQRRRSGEPYIHHPLQAAQILAEMHLDAPSIMAAILHDVIEDTPTLKSHIARVFSNEVAELVDGVSKLDKITFGSHAELQADSFRKMLLAMARDIRVILVKLADRLHNMRTIGALDPERRRRIARETLEIYAPIATRLGLNNIRLELEDLGFATLHPMRYRVLAAQVKRARGHRKQVVKKILTTIKRRARQEGLEGQVLGREKHLYGLYRKMQDRKLSFSEVLDVYGFRIIVDTVDTCYRVLGTVHNLYKPVPGKFKDYIAIPKANGYQSLHTVLFGPYGAPIEVQIRTEDMHAVAESGVAAHWMYKTSSKGVDTAQKRARQWLRDLLEMQKQAGNSIEFIENVKIDLFPDEIYVFTPTGDIMELPRLATPVDLAYAVHTDVGRTCVAAKADRRYVPLGTRLDTGQTVEIVTAPWGRPNPNWLNFVVTAKARTNIRAFLKNLRKTEAVELGLGLLNQSLAADTLSLDKIEPDRLNSLLEELGIANVDELLEQIGLGEHVAPLLVRRLVPGHVEGDVNATRYGEGGESSMPPLHIKGTEGMVVHFGKCCHPIPGDDILGFVSTGRGIVVHTQTCHNRPGATGQSEKWIEVEWRPDTESYFPVEFRVEVSNHRGVLATVAATIADSGANIDNVVFEERDGLHSALKFVVEVTDRTHLATIMRRLRGIREVWRIVRTRG